MRGSRRLAKLPRRNALATLSMLWKTFSPMPLACGINSHSLITQRLNQTKLNRTICLPYSRENMPGFFKTHAVSERASFRAFSSHAYSKFTIILRHSFSKFILYFGMYSRHVYGSNVPLKYTAMLWYLQ